MFILYLALGVFLLGGGIIATGNHLGGEGINVLLCFVVWPSDETHLSYLAL